jgi:hypothetical protein
MKNYLVQLYLEKYHIFYIILLNNKLILLKKISKIYYLFIIKLVFYIITYKIKKISFRASTNKRTI